MTRKDYTGAHDWRFDSWKEGSARQFFGPANGTDLWHIKKVNPRSMRHRTVKPVELTARSADEHQEPTYRLGRGNVGAVRVMHVPDPLRRDEALNAMAIIYLTEQLLEHASGPLPAEQIVPPPTENRGANAVPGRGRHQSIFQVRDRLAAGRGIATV